MTSHPRRAAPPARAQRLVRSGRTATAWLLGVAFGLALIALSASRGQASEHLDDDELNRGGKLYAANCVACHGASGEGGPGAGILAGPRIDDIDVALADLVIRTGRMPIVHREAAIIGDPDLDARDRELIVGWMTERFGLDGQVPTVPDGDTARGRLLFNENCAACHSTTGWGGVSGNDVVALPIRDLDRVALFSAARVGPLAMPSFPESVLSDEDLADIAAAVEQMDRERPSPVAFTDLTHVSGTVYSAIAVVMIVGLVVAVSRLPRITVARDEEYGYEDPGEPEGST